MLVHSGSSSYGQNHQVNLKVTLHPLLEKLLEKVKSNEQFLVCFHRIFLAEELAKLAFEGSVGPMPT